jgi:tryptophanyl-tRNA synthetase
MINDTPETIMKKIMTAVTDSTNAVSYDPINRRGVSNLIELLSHFDKQGRSPAELGEIHAGLGLKAFKILVAEAIAEKLTPIRERYEILMRRDNGSYLDDVARVGAQRASESSRETMHVVREAMGL